MRQTIAEVASGKVEMVFDGQEMTVQFNARCEDALPYCHAMCCRLRQYFNVTVDDDEAEQYVTMTVEGLRVLPVDQKRNCCAYLAEDESCGIHARKPRGCAQWHCSPGGKGDGVTQRGRGWVLLPAGPGQPRW